MTVSSPAFRSKASIPALYTCDGSDINPPLMVEDIPANTATLALIVDDPDAPGHTWVHWVVFNIRPDTRITQNSVPGTQGTNDFGRRDYGGPCPPSGAHRYYFKVYALDATLDLPPGCSKEQLLEAMEGHVLDHGELVALYSRR